MKSFFKKLSLVLAAAMVITMLPLQSAKAATTVGIGTRSGNKVTTGTSFTMEVGETQQWGFSGVTPYNQTAIATKKFVSDNTAVVTVAADKLTAVAAGIANITFTCNNGTTDFIGKATVTVKAAGSQGTTVNGVEVKQVAYNAVTVTFPDSAAAEKAVKAGIKVERVKASAKGAFYLSVKPTTETDKNVVTLTGLADGSTYRITVSGIAQPFEVEMSVGAPAALILEYPTVYIGTGTDILNKNVKNPTVTPSVKVVDANGIKTNANLTKDVKYTYDRTKTQYANFTASSGKIKFSNINGQCFVTATYTYKDAAGKQVTLTDSQTVSPVAYTAPNLQGFVEQICLTNKTGKDIVYPNNYDFEGTLAVGQSAQIAYYFETPEGDRYCGVNVSDTVTGNESKVQAATAKEYVYYFEKDDPSAVVVSLHKAAKTTTVRGWNEGTERICLYKQEGTKANPLTDTLVGVIDITVQPEPYVFDLGLTATDIDGFENGLKTDGEIGYSLVDQYGDKIKGELVASDINGGLVNSFVTIEKKDDYTGKIKFDFAALKKTEEAKEVVISVKGQKDLGSETVSVNVDKIDNTSSDIGYEVIVKDKAVKNSDLQNSTSVGNIGVKFEVARTYDGNRYDKVPFAVIADKDLDVATSAAGILYLVISDLDNKVVEKDARGAFHTTANAVTAMEFTFDAYNDTATDLGNNLITGTYNVVLYNAKSTTAGDFDVENELEVTISNNTELIQNVGNTYGIKRKGDGLETDKEYTVWTGDGAKRTIATDLTDEAKEAAYFDLVEDIVAEFKGWFDRNSDGKVTDSEIVILGALDGYKLVDAKFVPGATNNEVYIKTVTIEFKTSGETDGSTYDTPVVAHQTITVNRKYTH